MKKAYKSPQATITKIAGRHFICASEYGTSVYGPASNEYETLSRRHSVWDENEDDDY